MDRVIVVSTSEDDSSVDQPNQIRAFVVDNQWKYISRLNLKQKDELVNLGGVCIQTENVSKFNHSLQLVCSSIFNHPACLYYCA